MNIENNIEILNENITEDIDQYVCCIENIGNGSFGKISKGLNLNNGKTVIIKTIYIRNNNDSTISNENELSFQNVDLSIIDSYNQYKLSKEEIELNNKIMREIDIMKRLNHKNIIGYIDSIINDVNKNISISIYMEDICGKKLSVLYNISELPYHFIKNIFVQILNGLEYMHNNNIIHKDIKTGNILLGNDGIIKIIDFGESEHITTNNMVHTISGSPLYMAPEVVNGSEIMKEHIFKCDIWSVAILLVELYVKHNINIKYKTTLSLIFGLNDNPYIILHECLNAIYNKITKSIYEPLNHPNIANYDKLYIIPLITKIFLLHPSNDILNLIDLICLCLEPNILKRYTIKEIFEHPFIKNERNIYYSDLVKSGINYI